jgi:hypothetical protein
MQVYIAFIDLTHFTPIDCETSPCSFLSDLRTRKYPEVTADFTSFVERAPDAPDLAGGTTIFR